MKKVNVAASTQPVDEDPSDGERMTAALRDVIGPFMQQASLKMLPSYLHTKNTSKSNQTFYSSGGRIQSECEHDVSEHSGTANGKKCLHPTFYSGELSFLMLNCTAPLFLLLGVHKCET